VDRGQAAGLIRLKALIPVALWLAALLALDQGLLAYLTSRHHPVDGEATFRRYAATADTTRPQLIILGSSRAEDGLPDTVLQAEIDRAGLPYRAINLSVGGGGTPAYLYAGLADFTKALAGLPPRSRVVYVFSLFELHFLKVEPMLALKTGREMLARHDMINRAHWVYRLKDRSGFARFAHDRLWKKWFWSFRRMLEDSTTPADLRRQPTECNAAGLSGYKVLPINVEALEKLVDRFGDALILVSPPVSERQHRVDAAHGLDRIGLPFMRDFTARRRLVYRPGFGDEIGLPERAFIRSCDHLTRAEDKRAFARAIVGLLKS
jgi:hypothetical protein